MMGRGFGAHEEDAVTRPTREIDHDRAEVATYRIRVMALSVHRGEPKGTFSELAGELADEAALMGVLDALYIHGAHLLSVDHVDEDGTSVVKLEHSPEAFKGEKDP